MITVYIASASKELVLIETFRDELARHGIMLTHDWTVDVRKESARKDHELTIDEQCDYALNDVQGVLDCDVFWLVTPKSESKGCWVELGIAIGRIVNVDDEKLPTLIVSGPWSTIFASLADITVPTHEEALLEIVARSKE